MQVSVSHFLQFILMLLELFLAMKFYISAGSVSTLSTAKSRPITCKNVAYIDSWVMDVLWGGGVGGSTQKRPNNVVGEKINLFATPK